MSINVQHLITRLTLVSILLATTLLALSIACSPPEPEPMADSETQPTATSQIPAESTTSPNIPQKQPTSTPTPTRPPASTRSPSDTPSTTETSPAPTTVVQVPVQDLQPSHIGSDDPTARLIPSDPEFDDSILLSAIYEQIDLNQFALDPNAAIDWFEHPQCDYNVEQLTAQSSFAFNNDIVQDHWDGNVAVCSPITVNLHQDPIKGAQISTGDDDFRADQTVNNASPTDVILAHPYRFAFKNTHILANHRPDPQLIRFAANYRANLDPAIKVPIRHAPDDPTVLLEHYDAAGAQQPQGLIGAELWLQHSWYVPAQWPQPNQPQVVSFPRFHEQSLAHDISKSVLNAFEQAEERANTGMVITQIKDNQQEFPIHLDLRQALTAPNVQVGERPLVQWEFISPYLPIIRVTTYNEQFIPFGHPTNQEVDGFEFEHPDMADADDVEPTRYAVSFVVALQQRWTSFNDPGRINHYSKNPLINPNMDEYQIAPEQVNRWYATDFMQHSLIGPVVVQIFESPQFATGVYHHNPQPRIWLPMDYSKAEHDDAYIIGEYAPISYPRQTQTSDGTVLDYTSYLDQDNAWHISLAYGLNYSVDAATSIALPNAFPTEYAADSGNRMRDLITGTSIANRPYNQKCGYQRSDWFTSYTQAACYFAQTQAVENQRSLPIRNPVSSPPPITTVP